MNVQKRVERNILSLQTMAKEIEERMGPPTEYFQLPALVMNLESIFFPLIGEIRLSFTFDIISSSSSFIIVVDVYPSLSEKGIMIAN